MNGSHIIDIALIISLIVQATKLSDFVFTDDQKQDFQNKMELFTATLQSIKPEAYFFRLFEQETIKEFVVKVYYAFALLTLAALLFRIVDYKEYQNKTLLSLILQASMGLIAGWIAFNIYGFKILRWLLNGDFIIFFLRLCLLFSAFAGTMVFEQAFREYFSNAIFRNIFLLAFLLSGWFAVGLIVSCYGLIVALFHFSIFVAIILLKIGKWLTIRIVEYNKGAVAAISLLLTVTLGIIDVIMKSKK